MKPRVYVETSVVSYLTAWPSNNVIIAARQQITQEWWATADLRFERVVSEVVLREASGGDPNAAHDRLQALTGLTILDLSSEAANLANLLIGLSILPLKAEDDAAHIAIAATNNIEYLLTWNFKHIANPSIQNLIVQTIITEGYSPPVLLTPEEHMELLQ